MAGDERVMGLACVPASTLYEVNVQHVVTRALAVRVDALEDEVHRMEGEAHAQAIERRRLLVDRDEARTQRDAATTALDECNARVLRTICERDEAEALPFSLVSSVEVRTAVVQMRKAAQVLARGRSHELAAELRHRANKLHELLKTMGDSK